VVKSSGAYIAKYLEVKRTLPFKKAKFKNRKIISGQEVALYYFLALHYEVIKLL
jgi:hypothetical protein